MAKKYYWLKLPDDWFRQKSIKKLRRIAGGDTYTIIYLKMLLVAIKQDSKLYFEGIEDNFHEELSLEIDEDPENVRIALAYLQAQHLVELREADEFFLPEAKKLTGSESDSAERVRRYRDRKALQCNDDVTRCNDGVTRSKRLCNVEIEKEIEIEIDNNNIYCPEASSGPNEKTEKTPPAGLGVEEMDTPPAYSAKGIGAGAAGAKGAGAGKDQAVLATFPCIGGKKFVVTADYAEHCQELYPAVNVEQEINNMAGWLEANKRNRKTVDGIPRFIHNWLKKEQNRAPREAAKDGSGRTYGRSNPGVKQNMFTSFGLQNRYSQEEIDEIERLCSS